ncbi:TVP38/TMEM64 family protein [Priestia koreensis]|uniref:TVP38/TMEM64 family protein n=1 Tax=Priestia koreensis TaxID=284581 RepID=UPI001F591062|nr:TVP38/TMEM64 family protein [Priestia koreensis]MCM3004793.1 TVP38/TMEM64 family protein [Priestia koreensis]UNL85592.1 TVP38/TMEM64 family protein [Priestia koreensis]
MNWETIQHVFSMDYMLKLISDYRSLGAIPAILLLMLEAFIPILPLVAFVIANAAAFGLWGGFLISWAGACLGALLVFLLIRKFGRQRFFRFLSHHSGVKRIMNWIEQHGFGPIFLLLCFPFTPSAAINVVAGLSKVSIMQFMLAVLSGKMVMIFMISFIGADLSSFVRQPFKAVIVAVVIFVLWFVGKRVEARLNKTTNEKIKEVS